MTITKSRLSPPSIMFSAAACNIICLIKEKLAHRRISKFLSFLYAGAMKKWRKNSNFLTGTSRRMTTRCRLWALRHGKRRDPRRLSVFFCIFPTSLMKNDLRSPQLAVNWNFLQYTKLKGLRWWHHARATDRAITASIYIVTLAFNGILLYCKVHKHKP